MSIVIEYNNFNFSIDEDVKEASLVGHRQGRHEFTEESSSEVLLRVGDFKERFLRIYIPEKIPYDGEMYTVSSITENAMQRDYSLVEVFVPETIRCIGENAFSCCHYLESVHLSEGLENIGDYAFCWCENLSSIEIPDTVNDIGECAFRMCHSLTSVKLPRSLSIISNGLFSECGKLKHIALPDSVKIICENAFYLCRGLENINIPEQLEYIGENAFSYCAVEEADFPKTLKKICDGAFYETKLRHVTFKNVDAELHLDAFYSCNKMRRIVVPNGGKDYYLKKMEDYYEDFIIIEEGECVVYEKDKFVFYLYPNREAVLAECTSQEYDIVLPGIIVYEGVEYRLTKIRTDVFHDCSFVEYITLPDTMTSIDDEMFAYYMNVETFDFSGSIERIGVRAFKACHSLYEMTIPEGVAEIDDYAFEDCDELVEITLPKSIKIVGQHIFRWCDSLEKIKVPKGYLCHFEKLLPEYKKFLEESDFDLV